MKAIIIIIIVLLVLFWLYLLCLRCRRGKMDQAYFRQWRYAHRGLHDREKGIPENSMAAFKRAAANGFGAELDVHLMKDGQLAVIHDASLLRTAGADVEIEDLTAEALEQYPAYYQEVNEEELDPEIFQIMAPPAETLDRCEIYENLPKETLKLYDRLWTRLGV